MTHAWSTDPARDAAVRAAEDGRDRPLPTLKEEIAGVFPKSVSASSAAEQENKGDGMATNELRTERGVTNRRSVYKAIDRERDYQESLGPDRSDGNQRSVGDYCTMLSSYTAKLIAAWTDNPGDTQALDVFRKIAGIAVHCMEDHGIVDRGSQSVRIVTDEEIDAPEVFDQDGDRVLIAWERLAKALKAERDAAIRERDVEKRRADRDSVKCSALAEKVLSLRDRVAELEAEVEQERRDADRAVAEAMTEIRRLEAASGGGEGEPVAWGVMIGGKIDQHAGSDALFVDKEEADEWCHDAAMSNLGTVVPLYRAPPPPRGWLSEDDRRVLSQAADVLDNTKAHAHAKFVRNLLARSTPPVVMLPFVDPALARIVYGRDTEWLASLAAAGVAVKEVGDG
jgi:hypothetical protein